MGHSKASFLQFLRYVNEHEKMREFVVIAAKPEGVHEWQREHFTKFKDIPIFDKFRTDKLLLSENADKIEKGLTAGKKQNVFAVGGNRRGILAFFTMARDEEGCDSIFRV